MVASLIYDMVFQHAKPSGVIRPRECASLSWSIPWLFLRAFYLFHEIGHSNISTLKIWDIRILHFFPYDAIPPHPWKIAIGMNSTYILACHLHPKYKSWSGLLKSGWWRGCQKYRHTHVVALKGSAYLRRKWLHSREKNTEKSWYDLHSSIVNVQDH